MKLFIKNASSLLFKISKHPLVILLIGAFLGNYIAGVYAKKNLIREAKIGIYKEEINKRDEFMSTLMSSIDKKIGAMECLYISLKYKHTKGTVADYYDKYTTSIDEWDMVRASTYMKLGKYFPKDIKIGNDENDDWKSFRQFLETIEDQFDAVDEKISDKANDYLDKNIKLTKNDIKWFEQEIISLYSMSHNMAELLSTVSDYYNKDLLEKLSKEDF